MEYCCLGLGTYTFKKYLNMKKSVILLSIISLLNSCNIKNEDELIQQWKNEILKTEQEFALLTEKEGISKAFLAYADENAVLMRNNSLISGKKALINYFKNSSNNEKVTLTWKPDFVEVAASGDLGYTYGKYSYSFVNSEEKSIETKGVFHTVWKRQANGKWKFVWD